MIYSSRLKKILYYCLTHKDEFVSLDELATLLKISKRTIFRELKDIDQDLKSYGLQLHNKSGKGICLEGSEEMKTALQEELQTQGIEYINKEERQHLLIFELLRCNEVTKLVHFANVFQVSQASISNDLDMVEPWFSSYHVELIRTPGLGVMIRGEEANVRHAMTSLLQETLQRDSNYHSVNYLDSQTLLQQIFIRDDQSSIMRLLNQEILERVLIVFNTYQHELSLDRYVQTSYIGLIIHLVIAIDRILKKEEIGEHEQVFAMIENDVSFIQAEKMAQYLEMEFDIDIPKTETAFIALHIKGAKIANVEYSDIKGEEITKATTIIQNMLQSYDEELRIQFVQDEELIHGLLTHLVPTIIRLKNNLPIYNPLLQQIKDIYQDLYMQTKKACEWIKKEFECEVSEDEIGFITMHIGASLERSKQEQIHYRDVNIGIVCASGIGVSALLAARIQKAFPQGIQMCVLSIEEVLRDEYSQCEVLISTFPLTNTRVEVICTSPLLNSEDIVNIKKVIAELRRSEAPLRMQVESDFRNKMMQMQTLSANVLDIIDNLQISLIDEAITYEEIIQLIAHDHGIDEAHCRQIYQDIKKRELLGSVIMKDLRFALFHAKSKGMKNSALHIYYPQSICFNTGILNDLQFIISLLSTNDQDLKKQKMLATITRSLIDNESFFEAIINRNEKKIEEACIHILHEYVMDTLEELL